MDIKQQIKTAMADDEIKSEIAKLRAPARGKIGKCLDFLNSHFGGWLLGTVLLGVFTFGWTFYQETYGSVKQQKDAANKRAETEKRNQESREDSEFLSKTFLETSKTDEEKNCRIAQLMDMRHSDCKNDLTSAPCQWLRGFKAEIKIESYSIESCKAYVVQKVDDRPSLTSTQNRPQGEATPQTVTISPVAKNAVAEKLIRELPARVYIQIFDEQDRGKAKDFQAKLRSSGFIVPGIENVGDDNGGKAQRLNKNVIRCYDKNDCERANDVKAIVGSDFSVEPNAGNANSGTLEVWFKAP